MGGGIRIDDPVATAAVELAIKADREAAKLLPKVDSQQLGNAILKLINNDVMKEAEALGKIDRNNPTANPAIAAFEKARERVNNNFDPKRITKCGRLCQSAFRAVSHRAAADEKGS
jgi:hypothetical protein